MWKVFLLFNGILIAVFGAVLFVPLVREINDGRANLQRLDRIYAAEIIFAEEYDLNRALLADYRGRVLRYGDMLTAANDVLELARGYGLYEIGFTAAVDSVGEYRHLLAGFRFGGEMDNFAAFLQSLGDVHVRSFSVDGVFNLELSFFGVENG